MKKEKKRDRLLPDSDLGFQLPPVWLSVGGGWA